MKAPSRTTRTRSSENLRGYSDGGIITAGVLNGVINPFGAQSAAGDALIASAALDGNVQNAKGTTTGLDFHVSRELGDWLGAGRGVGDRLGAEAHREKFLVGRQSGVRRQGRRLDRYRPGHPQRRFAHRVRHLRRAERADPEDARRHRGAALRQVQRLRQHHQPETRLPLPADQAGAGARLVLDRLPRAVAVRNQRGADLHQLVDLRRSGQLPWRHADPGQVGGGELRPAIPGPDRRQHRAEAGKIAQRHHRPRVRADQQPDPGPRFLVDQPEARDRQPVAGRRVHRPGQVRQHLPPHRRPATWPPTVRSARIRPPAAMSTCAPRTWAAPAPTVSTSARCTACSTAATATSTSS